MATSQIKQAAAAEKPSKAAPFFVLRQPLRSAAAPILGDFKTLNTPTEIFELLSTDPILLPAIFLASRSLFQAVIKWMTTQPDNSKSAPDALIRYLSRARSRATPFGLFGILSCGRIEEQSNFPLIDNPQSIHIIHRASYETEVAARQSLLATSSKRTLKCNPTLWRQENRFIALVQTPSAAESCSLVTVSADPELDEIFYQFHSPIEVDHEEIDEISDLIETGILTEYASQPNLLETPHSPEYSNETEHHSRNAYDRIQQWIAQLNSIAIGGSKRIELYSKVDEKIHQLLGDKTPNRPSITANVFSHPQPEKHPTLSKNLSINTISLAMKLVQCFGEPNRALQQFKSAFLRKHTYESTPLLEFAYSELGLKFDQCTLQASSFTTKNYLQYDKYFLNSVLKSARDQSAEVQLSWAEICPLLANQEMVGTHLVSPVFSLISKENNTSHSEGLLWHGMEVATGTALLSRFETDNAELNKYITQWLQDNADIMEDDCIHAEIVYLPHPKLGDVFRRITRTPYAIFLTPCHGDFGPNSIKLETLHVRIRNDKFELWCSELQKKIKPTLSIPHYHQHSTHRIYRFLSALATQNLETASLRIPDTIRDLEYCPRIVVDGTIFRPATWKISSQKKSSTHQNLESLRKHLQKLGIPNKCAWSHRDQILAVDLSNNVDLETLQALLKKEPNIQLTEVIAPIPGLSDHEIILPIRISPNTMEDDVKEPTLPLCGLEKQNNPGSEYIYFKLFSDMEKVDQLPQKIHIQLGRYFRKAGLKPFYTKYSDPTSHLRFRLHVPEKKSWWRIMQKIYHCAENLKTQGWIDYFSISSYEPEIERYGGSHAWKYNEHYFSADSIFSQNMLSFIRKHNLSNDFVIFSMAISSLRIASDFGISLDKAADLLKNPIKKRKTNPSKISQAAGEILRRLKDEITDITQKTQKMRINRELKKAANQRTADTKEARGELNNLLGNDQIWFEWLFRSHAHMSMNRMLQADMNDAEQIANALAVRLVAALTAKGVHHLE
ncbi:thiopeptide-type bacteriocin biosynthesis protein [Chromobacterium vaccinii]|uniref:Thiopeptide-type bacteriocin biosynthesis protein n=1 Tax=Chromobacterium vaccinii TaxID=1108595 RepID=A0ABV0FJ33_9NEIS